MRFRKFIALLGTLLVLGLSACSGSGSTTSEPLPQQPTNPTGPTTSNATVSYTLSQAAASYALPAVGGYTGSFDFPAASVTPNTTLTLTSRLPDASDSSASMQRHAQSSGQYNLYFINTMTVSKSVSLPGFPGITLTLPSNASTTGVQFFYAIQKLTPNPGTLETFRTEGPATVTGHTVKVPASLTPVTFNAGTVFQVQLYSITPVHQPQGMWIANGTNVLEFVQSQLPLGLNKSAPAAVLNSAVFAAPQGVQFDVAGNLWVIDGGAGATPSSLYMFTPAQLSALHTNNHPAPAITIRSAKFKFIQQAVFDTNNDMWVTDNGNNALFEFTPSQLATGGANVTPHTTVLSSPAFNGPLGLAFGPTGHLWIANNGTTTIFGFDPPLPTSGIHTLTPKVILSDNGAGSIQGSWALVFDTAGNLWSSNANAPQTVVEFASASLGATGKPNPAVTISPAIAFGFASLIAPNGLAFDNAGDLSVVSSGNPFPVGIYGPSQLKTGKIVPDVFIVDGATTLNAPAGNVFGPLH